MPRRSGIKLALLSANALLPLALLVFSLGFFPQKPFMPGYNEFHHSHLHDRPSVPFDKLIFMVVDALRSDFVFAPDSGFQYTQSLIRHGKALPFTAYADPPTVTMPRLKALTTGSVPSFLDVVLNFAEGDSSSSLLDQDNWLSQMHRVRNANLTLFGDDTWLKLFPGLFHRYDGTSSFFVSDFTEVDNNVTRHIANEMIQHDWQVMVLHYLGLDHIGHKQGPSSVNMLPKQTEMDKIVQKVYSSLTQSPNHQSTLFVLLGDHGMNEGGNHGGSSAGETSPALVLISPKFEHFSLPLPAPVPKQDDFELYHQIRQSDLCVSLAAMFGLPVPLNNLGVLIEQILPLWEPSSQQQLLYENVEQLFSLSNGINPSLPSFKLTEETRLSKDCLAKSYEQGQHALQDAETMRQTYACLRESQSRLSRTASTYLTQNLWLGAGIVVVAVALSSYCLYSLTPGPESLSTTPVSLLVLSLSHASIMFASSFVEEEQQFWYWMAPAWFAVLSANRARYQSRHTPFESLQPLFILRLIKRWRQTGQKYAGSSDLSGKLVEHSPLILWLLCLSVYSHLGWHLFKDLRVAKRLAFCTQFTSIVLILGAIVFKFSFTMADAPELTFGLHRLLPWLHTIEALIFQARLVFLTIGAYLCLLLFSPRRDNSRGAKSPGVHLATVLLATQSKTINIPILGLFALLSSSFQKLRLGLFPELLGTLLLTKSSYFAMGGSNAVSSVDLSNAYNGIANFNVAAVGLLLFISNWSGPLYWAASMIGHRVDLSVLHRDRARMVAFLTFAEATGLLAVLLACTILRDHLFIWTVFSPKFLLATAWTTYHVFVTITIMVIPGC